MVLFVPSGFNSSKWHSVPCKNRCVNPLREHLFIFYLKMEIVEDCLKQMPGRSPVK